MELQNAMGETMQQTKTNVRAITVQPNDLDNLLDREWLLTNSRGSYASGTLIGCNTRRYHGLLVAALRPPVERVVTLSNVLERVTVAGQTYELANFEFSDRLHPQGYRYLKEFWRDGGVHFLYEFGSYKLEKSVHLAYDHNVVVLDYALQGPNGPINFSLMPLLAMRGFHHLQSSSASLTMDENDGVVTTQTLDWEGPALHMFCREGTFRRGADWWYSMHYRQDARRGQDNYEDVWAPGHFECEIDCPGRVRFLANATAGLMRSGLTDLDGDAIVADLETRQTALIDQAGAVDEDEVNLVKAADQFVVRRAQNETNSSATILAGYHWFGDWGRDTFISLPGLLLATNRFDEAKEVLLTFGNALSEGMIPNFFDDYGGPPHYNSVDASLWYVQAAYEFLHATGDRETFDHLRPVLEQIVDRYRNGTRFDIHADTDGLLTAGNNETQLTWMDARCNGVSFTPRYGKAVEVNALYIHALNVLATTAPHQQDRQRYTEWAQQATQSFNQLFWNESKASLNDCVFPDGRADDAIRPNQILAVSLGFSPLEQPRQLAVVSTVSQHLLTPYGLRSLTPHHNQYQGHYAGDQFQRDSAYHQGTVWGWLIGPFVEAYLKAHNYSLHAKLQARELVEPLLRHINTDACIGSVSEIFDGDDPHRPNGTVAQAWSVAELLRVKKLLRQT